MPRRRRPRPSSGETLTAMTSCIDYSPITDRPPVALAGRRPSSLLRRAQHRALPRRSAVHQPGRRHGHAGAGRAELRLARVPGSTGRRLAGHREPGPARDPRQRPAQLRGQASGTRSHRGRAAPRDWAWLAHGRTNSAHYMPAFAIEAQRTGATELAAIMTSVEKATGRRPRRLDRPGRSTRDVPAPRNCSPSWA